MTLTIALPSKGRLRRDAMEIFDRANLPIEPIVDDRSYQSHLKGRADVDIRFLSASDIAGELARGSIHLGVTGEDLARETIAQVDEIVDFLTPLGFGHADVVVAVPEAWIDVETMADLDDVASEYRTRYSRRLRIATKYWQLTQSYFRSHGIGVYRIVESLGATEGAPAAGSADAIVDITSTGSTIRANQLKILEDGIILQSQANLIASKRADWPDETVAVKDEVVAKIKRTLEQDAPQ